VHVPKLTLFLEATGIGAQVLHDHGGIVTRIKLLRDLNLHLALELLSCAYVCLGMEHVRISFVHRPKEDSHCGDEIRATLHCVYSKKRICDRLRIWKFGTNNFVV
jgi:hypothetical protein